MQGVQRMSSSQWVDGFLERAAGGLDIDRVVEASPGVDAGSIMSVLGDERLGPDVIQAMSDLMHPTDSMYFDAIFGPSTARSPSGTGWCQR